MKGIKIEISWEAFGRLRFLEISSKEQRMIRGVVYEYVPKTLFQRVLGSDYLIYGKGYWILLYNGMKQCELTVEIKL
jgi:hypothetical protein